MKINPGETAHLFKLPLRNKQMRVRRMGRDLVCNFFFLPGSFSEVFNSYMPVITSFFFSSDLVCLDTRSQTQQTWHHYFESFFFSFCLHIPPTHALSITFRWVLNAPLMVVLFLSAQQLLKCHLWDVRDPFLFYSFFFFEPIVP